MSYNAVIRNVLAARGLIGRYDSRHVEAAMRENNGTLDALTGRQFKNAVVEATQLIDIEGEDVYARIASDMCIREG